MALLTRTISSAGDPLCAPDGTALAGVTATFTLVNLRGMPIDAWDAQTHERVVGATVVTTDEAVTSAAAAQASAEVAVDAAAAAQQYVATYAQEMAAMAAALVQTQAIVAKHHGFN